MSADQDQDPVALKRVRGGESALDGLGPSIQLGSPDKKKRKANTQGPSFPPLSEYAPPPNPNADHLVAANPFDDNYGAISYRPPPAAASGTYLGPGYPGGFGGYGPFRMPPHGPPRVPSPYCGPYPLRNQPPPFPQNPLGLGFSRPHALNFGPPDGASFGNPAFSPVPAPNAHFRPGPADGSAPWPPRSADPAAAFAPGPRPSCSPPPEPPPPGLPPPSAFAPAQAPPPQPDASPAARAPHLGSARPPPPGPAEPAGQGPGEPRRSHAPGPESARPGGPEAGRANGTQSRAAADRTPERSGPGPVRPGRGRAASDPVFPCGICALEVKDDQDAILCEAACQKWFHRTCTGMTESAYGLLTAEAAAVWGCDACMAERDVPLLRPGEPPAAGSEA